MPATTLVEGASVVTVDTARRVLAPGSVLVADDRIADLGRVDELRARHPTPDAVVDGRGKALLPGFVSIHNHLGYAVFRGRAEDVGFDPTHRLYLPMATVMGREQRAVIGHHALLELLRGGVTTVLEMEEDADVFAAPIAELGLRAGLGVMVSDLDLEALARRELNFDEALRERQLEQAVTLAERCHGAGGGRVQGVLAATGISCCSKPLLAALREQADRLGVRLSSHMGFGERALVRQVHGAEQLDVAEEAGLLGADLVAVHCYELDAAEVARLAASGTHLAHCPLMNQFRGEIAPVEDLRAGGMNVGLGIDNYFTDFFDLMRALVASARIRARHPETLSAAEALEFATVHGARALGLETETGSIEVGKKADLQLVDLRRPGLTPAADLLGTLVYHAHGRDVVWVMVDGRVIFADGRVHGVDEQALMDEATSAAGSAWLRFAERYGSHVAPAPPR